MRVGTAVFSAATSVAVVFDRAFPFVPSVTLTAGFNTTNIMPYVTALTINGFTANFSTAKTGSVYWQAVSYAS